LIEPSPEGLSRPVRLVFSCTIAAYLGIALWLIWRTSILEPYSDMYDWLVRWRLLQADGDLGRYLWAPHNFHHLVWTFAILRADITLFGAQGYLFLAVGGLCLAAVTAMAASIGAAAAGRGMRLIGAGVAAALSAMGCHVLDASADINTTYLHALAFAVAAILLAEGPGARSRLRNTGALACALAAGLGSAAGLAIWPALLFGAWRTGRRGWLFAVFATGAIFCGFYVAGQGASPNEGAVSPLIGRLGSEALLFVNYLGLPWARGIPEYGWLIGMAVLVAALAALAFKGGRDAPWPERTAVPLIVFSVTTAAMAGVARTGMIAPDLVPMRYAVFLIPLHVGLWVLALPFLRRLWVKRPRRAGTTVIAVAGLMILHQGVMAVYAVRTADTNLGVIRAFSAGQHAPDMRATIYTDLDKAEALGQWLRREGFYQRELRPLPAPKP
jgi:hypothetical protein